MRSGDGVADMYHSAEYYWEKRSPAFSFFAAVPFGFTANELLCLGALRWRPGAVGRAQRPVQRQAFSLLQHRHTNGRLVHARNLFATAI